MFLCSKDPSGEGMRGSRREHVPSRLISEPLPAVDMTVYWGTIDGGTDPSLWEHEVHLGQWYKEENMNGFEGYGFPQGTNNIPRPNDSFVPSFRA